MAVPSDYDGERWDDDSSITDMFIQDLMERFRNQKSVHSKYAYKVCRVDETLLTYRD